MNQHGINTKNKIPKLNSYNAYTKINSKIKKDYKPNSNNNNSVYHEDNSLRLSRQRSPCNREENKSVRSISIQTKKKKFNSYTKSVDYRNTRIDNIITDAKANLNIPNSSGKPLSSHKSLMSTAKFEKIKNSSNDLMLLQNESMEIQEQYQTTYGSQCIKQCQTKFNKDILDKIKNRLIVKSHTIKSITSHNTSKTSGKKEMIKDNLNNSLQKKLNSTHFNLNKGSNSSHTNSKHHNAKSKSISLIDELMTFNKTKSLKSNLRERLLENSTKLSTNFNNYVNRFNNKLAKALSQVGSNRTSTLETTHFTRQDNQQEETKTEQTSNREEELFPKPKSSTFKNLCTSEKFFNEMGSKNFLISHNTSSSLLSKLSEESVFDSRNCNNLLMP